VSGTTWGNDATFTTAGFPIAITGIVSKTTANGTTLSGTINPCWAPTTYYFEYWTPAKTGTTGKASLASGGIGKGVSAAIIGLSATTTYSYHLVASNTNGQVTGADQTFTTAGPPMAGTDTAVSTVPGMLVSGSANADGLPTTVAFQYGLTTTYSGKTISQNAGTGRNWSPYSATIGALKSGTTYHYRIVATNSSGTVNGQDQTFTTPTSAPTVPTITVSSTGETVATLDAPVNSQNGATSACFQYGTTLAYGKTTGTATLTASGSASPLSVDLFALLPHTTYHVRCVAKNAQGTFNSADTSFKTLPRFDMNGEGFSELLVSNTATGETSLLSIGNATATSGTLTVTGSMAGPTLATDGTCSGQAEFHRNGTIGWVLSGSTVSETEFWTPDAGMSGNWTSNSLVTGIFAVPNGSTVAGIGDIDGDGNPDLVITGTNQKITFWMLNGFTATAQKAGPTLPAGYGVVGLDDLNGDGKLELLLWQPTTGKTQILALNGTALLSTTVGPVIPAGWQLVGVDVFTSAGTPNWLLFNPTTGATQLWMMKGVIRSSILTGPDIPAGFTLLGTK